MAPAVPSGDVGTLLRVKVVPGASRSAVAGIHGDDLRVRIAAPAERGKANAALVALLAERLGVRRAQIEVVRGASQPRKTLRIDGLRPDEVLERLVP